MDSKIKKYIAQLKKSGYNEDQIIKNIKRVGWYEDYIREKEKSSVYKGRYSSSQKISMNYRTGIKYGAFNDVKTLCVLALVFAVFFPPIGVFLGVIAKKSITEKTGRAIRMANTAIMLGTILFIMNFILIFLFLYSVQSIIN